MTVTARVRAGRKTRVDRVEEIFIFLIDEYCFWGMTCLVEAKDTTAKFNVSQNFWS